MKVNTLGTINLIKWMMSIQLKMELQYMKKVFKKFFS